MPQTQSRHFLGGSRVGGAGVVALLVVVVLDDGAGVVVEVVLLPEGSGMAELLLRVARVAFSESELPGRWGSSDRTHWMKVFCDCFSRGFAVGFWDAAIPWSWARAWTTARPMISRHSQVVVAPRRLILD